MGDHTLEDCTLKADPGPQGEVVDDNSHVIALTRPSTCMQVLVLFLSTPTHIWDMCLPWIVTQLPILEMEIRNKLCARKATWLAFGLIALAAISSAQNSDSYNSVSTPSFVSNSSNLISEDRRFLVHWLNSLQTIPDATSSSSVPTASENAIVPKPLSVSQRN